MKNFIYKKYSEEENRIYHESMARIIEGLKNGLNFHDACATVQIDNKELKGFIADDALKMMIADMHYIKGLSLPEVASRLKASIEAVCRANLEMLEDMSITAEEIFRLSAPDGPAGNA